MSTIPLGSTLTRRYYAVPEEYSTGTEYETISEATIAALEKWAAVDTDMPINPPVIDERWVLTYPDGAGHQDVLFSRDTVASYSTSAPFFSRAARAVVAGKAVALIRKLIEADGEPVGTEGE